MIYEIPSKQINPDVGSSYESHGVKEGQRMGFMHKGNFLFGKIVGCGKSTLLIQVDTLSY